MAEAAEKNPIEDLVQHALDQDFNKANKVFGDLMGVKINDVLDQEKIRLADQIYNGVEPEEEEDDDQLELDLEDEDQEDESEDDAEEDDEESAEEEAEEDLIDGEEDEEET